MLSFDFWKLIHEFPFQDEEVEIAESEYNKVRYYRARVTPRLNW